MTDSTRPSLRQLLVAGYADIRRRLTRRLGSEDLASEVLHETFVRLDDANNVAIIRRPDDYIFRVALNIAADQKRSADRRLSYSEVEALYHFADASIDAEREIEARSELLALRRAFAALTPRQRAIMIAVRIDGTSHAELALRFRVSERIIDKDLRRALEYCADQLERTLITRFGSRAPQSSRE